MQTLIQQFEVQIDEKPNGCVIRINNDKGCIIRVCSIPKEIVFDEQGEVRSFIDITYPKKPLNTYDFSNDKEFKLIDKFVLMNDIPLISANTKTPKNMQLSRLGKQLKKKK